MKFKLAAHILLTAVALLAPVAAVAQALPADINEPLIKLDSGGHTALVRALIFTQDGKTLFSAGDDKTIRVWNWRERRTDRLIHVPASEGHFGRIYALALSKDEKWLVVASDPRPVPSRGWWESVVA